jgi:hypothetical protein
MCEKAGNRRNHHNELPLGSQPQRAPAHRPGQGVSARLTGRPGRDERPRSSGWQALGRAAVAAGILPAVEPGILPGGGEREGTRLEFFHSGRFSDGFAGRRDAALYGRPEARRHIVAPPRCVRPKRRRMENLSIARGGRLSCASTGRMHCKRFMRVREPAGKACLGRPGVETAI